MNTAADFEQKLSKLDPQKDEFVLLVDDLIEDYNQEEHESFIPAIFRFFESHPIEDMGAPGTLVHLTEDYYPNYLPLLLESLKRRPSYNSILMSNRILNSKITDDLRTELLEHLTAISTDQNLEPELINEASEFLEFQKKRNK